MTQRSAIPDAGQFVSVRGKDIVDPNGELLRLKGIGLGNWLVPEGYMFHFDQTKASWQIQLFIKESLGPSKAWAFWEQWYNSYITREDVHYIKEMGMNLIRLPFDYRLLTPEDLPNVWSGPGFALMDRVVRWAEEEGIYVLLDMHAAPGDQTGEGIGNSLGYPWLYEDKDCRKRTVKVWRQVAEHYRRSSAVIGYDLLNAPVPYFDEFRHLDPLLESLYKEIVVAIREVDPNHLLFLSAVRWGCSFDFVTDARFDDRLIYAFQWYYVPPTEDEIRNHLAFRDHYSMPIFLVEFGENKDEWLRSVIEVCTSQYIGWACWPYKKMDATSSPVTFVRPPYWDEIIDYQRRFWGTFEEKRKARPLQAHINMAFDGLLDCIQFENRRLNKDHIRALGMNP